MNPKLQKKSTNKSQGSLISKLQSRRCVVIWSSSLDMEQCVDADSDVMKQLPGRTRPRWQQQLISGFVVGLGFVVMAALLPIVLPIMLIAGLLAALALIPILRQLRRELEQLDQVQRK